MSSSVKNWKTGTTRMAWNAQVALAGWHYPIQVIATGMRWKPSADANADT
jgi:hypothetical protein